MNVLLSLLNLLVIRLLLLFLLLLLLLLLLRFLFLLLLSPHHLHLDCFPFLLHLMRSITNNHTITNDLRGRPKAGELSVTTVFKPELRMPP